MQFPLWINFQTATLLKQKAMLGLDLEIDWISYFKKVWRVLRRMESLGIDTTAARQEFERALRTQDRKVRLAVNWHILTTRKKRKRPKSLIHGDDVLIRGDELGFTDILGATRTFYETYSKNGFLGREQQAALITERRAQIA